MASIAVEEIARVEPKRDHRGNYVLPDDEGKPRSFTRATTVAGTLDNRKGLEIWGQRQVAYGLGQRPDLYALAQSHTPDVDKKVYQQICEEAQAAAKSSASASMGTALHRFSEQVDLGLKTLNEIPSEHRAHMTRYVMTLDNAGIEIDREHVEMILIQDRYRVAGTADRIVTLPDGKRVIADLKTGGSLKPAWLKISIQLAIYANHTATYDGAAEERRNRIEVDRDEALIIWLPAKGEHCNLYTVDIKQGWDAFLCAMHVRDWRSAKGLAEEYRPFNGGSGGAKAQTDWIADRISALAGNAQAVADLINRWPSSVAQPPPSLMGDEEVTEMDRVLTDVEAAHQIPFGPSRPGTRRKQG